MRIVMKLQDGSEEVRDVAEAAIQVGEWLLQLRLQDNSNKLDLLVEGTDEAWCALVVRPRAANVLSIELEPHSGREITRKS